MAEPVFLEIIGVKVENCSYMYRIAVIERDISEAENLELIQLSAQH